MISLPHILSVMLLASALSATGDIKCSQTNAVYSDADGQLTLSFTTTESAIPGLQVNFEGEETVALTGFAIPNTEAGTIDAVLLHNCPEGDATGEEINACTVWQGTIYSVSAEGHIGLFDAVADAAPQLIFSRFGQAIGQSALYPDKISDIPWDVFGLTGCNE